MISKELLQQVVNDLTVKEVITNHNNKIDNNIYYTVEEVSILQCVNIHELAHKCKEWAYKKHNIIINSRTTSKVNPIDGYAEIVKNCDYLYGDYANTEPEAIFKACQWILENA